MPLPPPKTGWSDAQLTFNLVMTPEMWVGWQPISPRLFTTRHSQGVQDANATSVNPPAPFSDEMIAGWHPTRKAYIWTLHTDGGWWGDISTMVPPPTPIKVYGQKVNLKVVEDVTVGLTVWIEYRLR